MPLLALAIGCSKEDIVPAAESVTRFTLRVCPEETQAVTRAADERAVKESARRHGPDEPGGVVGL